MARPFKKGFRYFSFDVSFFRDPKIKKIKRELGDSAVLFYIIILAEIYENEEYFLSAEPDILCDLADTYLKKDTDLNWVNLVVGFFLEWSLFDNTLFKTDKVLTSRGIQLRFQEMVKERARNRIIEVPAKHWLLNKNETAAYIKLTQNESFSRENPDYSRENPDCSQENDTKRKVKKSKVNKSKEECMRSAAQNTAPTQKIYGTYKNVSLSDEDIEALKSELPTSWSKYIERLSEYMASTGKTYKNHLATIRSWAKNNTSGGKGAAKSKFNNYTDTNKPDYSNFGEQILDDMLGEYEKKRR